MKHIRQRAETLSINHLKEMQFYLTKAELNKLFFRHYDLIVYLDKKGK